MNLDQQLMAEKKGTAGAEERAGSLREAQRSGGTRSAGPDDFREDRGASMSLREAVLMNKNKNGQKKGGDETDEVASVMSSPISQGTSNLLSQSWKHLIDSWGLTLIWINIHVFLSYVMGEKLFRKLDHNLVEELVGGGASGVGAMAGAAAGKKPAGKSSSECCALAGCDLGCLFIILALCGLVAMLVGVISNPLEALSSLLSGIWGALTGSKQQKK